MSNLTAARERAQDAARAEREAKEASDAAWAELARLQLIELAAANPSIEGYEFSVEFEYDDEGGYYPSVSKYVVIGGDAIHAYDFNEGVDDTLVDMDLTPGNLVLLTGSEHGGEVSIERLKELSF